MRYLQPIGLALLLASLVFFTSLLFLGQFRLTDAVLQETVSEEHYPVLKEELASMMGETYHYNFSFASDFNNYFGAYNDRLRIEGQYEKVIWDDYAFSVTKASSIGFVSDNKLLLLLLTIVAGSLGALLYVLPVPRHKSGGLKHEGVYFASLKSRGWVGIVVGTYLIAFYVLLYWFAEYITNWVLLADPVSVALSGNPASKWFMYGLIYTLAIFNILTDFAHKAISPATYNCNLCALTYGTFARKQEWADYIKSLPLEVEFIYRDEWKFRAAHRAPSTGGTADGGDGGGSAAGC